MNYQKGQEAYLLNTGTFAGYEEGVPIQIGLSHDYFTVAVSVGQHLTYFDGRTGEQGDEILHAHPGICFITSNYSFSNFSSNSLKF